MRRDHRSARKENLKPSMKLIGHVPFFRRGSVLILVLWMLIILGIIGLTYTGSVRGQVQTARNSQGRREAYWAARAGVEKAMAGLMDTDLYDLTEASKLFDDEEAYKDQRIGHARFSL